MTVDTDGADPDPDAIGWNTAFDTAGTCLDVAAAFFEVARFLYRLDGRPVAVERQGESVVSRNGNDGRLEEFLTWDERAVLEIAL